MGLAAFKPEDKEALVQSTRNVCNARINCVLNFLECILVHDI